MRLGELNAMDREAFVASIGWVFEHSPWVAERAYGAKPFASVDVLHETMTSEMRRATRDEQMALLRAHPDLGARARMSDSSTAFLFAVKGSTVADILAALETRRHAGHDEEFDEALRQVARIARVRLDTILDDE
jgi:2-oxo-4-hydroxy-4-carboxy-5-ureidoimidazoline decarboxylase